MRPLRTSGSSKAQKGHENASQEFRNSPPNASNTKRAEEPDIMKNYRWTIRVASTGAALIVAITTFSSSYESSEHRSQASSQRLSSSPS